MSALFHPLNIYILGLGGGFLIPLIYRLAKRWLGPVFFAALAGITLVSAVAFAQVLMGAPAIEVTTAGIAPPVSISLRLGVAEGFFCLSVNLVSLLGAVHLWPRLRGHYGALLLYLIGVMGINGMVMTRDLFNLFVFLEIVSIATYGLLGLAGTPRSLSAAFKYIFATVIASAMFLLATALIYFVSGTLSIDELLSLPEPLSGPIAATALLLLLAALLVELKPFPANGWGLDVYETMPGGIASFVSVGVSAGVFFALYKLLPLFAPWLDLIAFSGALTFVASNLIGLRQVRVRRMLGYSSVGQLGLATLALALLEKTGAPQLAPLVVGGLILNHLLAKAGLFWLADLVDRQSTGGWSPLARSRLLLFLFAALVVAISGLPPFPGFWAKWTLVLHLSATGHLWIIAAIAVGSLMEAAYMFRWFGRSVHARASDAPLPVGRRLAAPVAAVVALLAAAGAVFALLAAPDLAWVFVPLAVGGLIALAEALLPRLPGRAKALAALLALPAVGPFLLPDTYGVAYLFGVVFILGGFVVGLGALFRSHPRPGYYPLLAVMLLALPALAGARTSLEFFVGWEFVTLGSYFLIAHGRHTGSQTLRYLLFSLAAAFLLLAGFGQFYAASGTTDLRALLTALGDGGGHATAAFVLIAAGCLIKAGALGVHVWVPGTYALADDDLSALLSAVISKVAIFGLLTGAYLAIRSEAGPELTYLLAWIGFATTLGCGVLALFQHDAKRLLAYSSVSQLGYIVAAIALMSHIGWVTALYLVASHLLVKGVLFLAVAGVLLRTGTGALGNLGGLAKTMPATFAAVLVALVAMAGLPPLAGFGSKWLLIGSMIDKGWYLLAAAGFLATFVGFVYMIRFAGSIFLGTARGIAVEQVREAPATLLVPQWLLIAGILVMSFYPALLMEPLSRAIDPAFAASLVWEGQSLQTIYDSLNPLPVMSAAVILSLTAAALVALVARARAGGGGGFGGDLRGLLAGALSLVRNAPLVRYVPSAGAFWNGVARTAALAAGRLRLVYTGNGQTYALMVLLYIIALHFLGSGRPPG